MNKNADIVVVGGGLVGLTTAIACRDCGYDVIVCAPTQTRQDPRTTAFLWQTVETFKKLDLWEGLSEQAFPLKVMRIVDGTNRLFRAPQTDFNSAEIGLEAFGYNLANQNILDVLSKRIDQTDGIVLVNEPVDTIEVKDGSYQVHAGSNLYSANLIVGADGRNSIVRDELLQGQRRWSYPQKAVVVDFDHQYSTHYVSTEFHTQTGPFTIVPRSQTHAGLVWMETPERADEIVSLTKVELDRLLEDQMQSFLGKITTKTKPASFPIEGLTAKQFGAGNSFLVGEAAHVFPPIGAQGFNLGVRDIQSLTDILRRYTGNEDRGALYDRARRADILTRTTGVDLLNRSLLTDFLPNQIARAAGLMALSSIGPLRKNTMKLGISPQSALQG
jgi:2-octaprenyl-6-methoxyphenol hydroxylase